MRSGLRSPCAAPVTLSTSSSIRRCAAKPTISRSKSASELFSSIVHRLIISSVIVGSLVRVTVQRPKPYRRSTMTTAVDKPRRRQTRDGRGGGPRTHSSYTTPRDTTARQIRQARSGHERWPRIPRFASDAPLEGGGFEPLVPQQIRSLFETARPVSHHGLIS